MTGTQIYLIIRLLLAQPVKPSCLPLKANQENLWVPNEYCLALPSL